MPGATRASGLVHAASTGTFESQLNLNLPSSSSIFGAPATINATATAAPPAPGTPTGSVTFNEAGVPIGTVPLVNGIASLTTSALLPGSRLITATYGGDSVFAPSNAQAVTQNVDLVAPTISVSVPDSSIAGQSVNAVATVTATAPGVAVPSGNLTFQVDHLE